MNQPAQPLLETLAQAGLIADDASAAAHTDSPWYVKLMLALFGWLSALFLLGFFALGLESLFDNAIATFVVGSFLIGAAFFMLRKSPNDFVEHLALAVSLAGQAMIAYLVVDNLESSWRWIWLIGAAFQAALAYLIPNFVHRVFSSCVAAYSLMMTLGLFGLPFLSAALLLFAIAWLWLNEFRYPLQMQRMQAAAYGMLLALIATSSLRLFSRELAEWQWSQGAQPPLWYSPWLSEALSGLVTLYVVWRLLQEYVGDMRKPIALAALGGTLLLCLLSMEARGITLGMTIVMLGFATGNRIVMGLGITALLFYISAYYYLLHITLLAKSGILLAAGVGLLLVRWIMLRLIPAQEAKHG